MSFDRVQFRSAAQDDSADQAIVTSQERTVPLNPARTAYPQKTVSAKGLPMKAVGGVLLVMLVLGVGTGFAVAQMTSAGSGAQVSATQDKTAEEVQNAVKVGATFGVADSKSFKDEVEGVLIKGGLAGEGSHTLLREGGKSQNVYLTSSVVDLDQFEGMKVKVLGETFKGQKAGWLMDVGRLEVVEIDAAKPGWYKDGE